MQDMWSFATQGLPFADPYASRTSPHDVTLAGNIDTMSTFLESSQPIHQFYPKDVDLYCDSSGSGGLCYPISTADRSISCGIHAACLQPHYTERSCCSSKRVFNSTWNVILPNSGGAYTRKQYSPLSRPHHRYPLGRHSAIPQ